MSAHAPTGPAAWRRHGLTALAVAAAGGAAALATGGGLVNYDTAYALLWGRDLTEGRLPDYEVVLAPTPHPLQTLWSAALAPLGTDGALRATLVLAFALLGALGLVVFRLGAALAGPAAGALAAALVLTRRPVLDFGARAYVDVPYLVLVLAAVLAEVRTPRAGARVVVLLGLAGLLRPEAWLLAGAYALWLRSPRLVLGAAAAPLLWALTDLLVTGDPLWSLTGTRANAETLGRTTGLDDVPLTAPRRVGEILRVEGLLLAVAGAAVVLRRRERPALVVVAAGVAGFLAFCVLAAAGLPILGRYLLLVAVLLAVVGAAVVREGRTVAVVALAVCLLGAPAAWGRIEALHRALDRQRTIQADLRAALERAPDCLPVTVPTHRPRPLVALWSGVRPRDVANAQDGVPPRGVFARPRSREVADDYVLDARDRDRRIVEPPSSFVPVARNGSWVVSAGC